MEEKEMLHLLQSEPERGIGQIIVQYEKAVHTICSSILRGFSEGEIEEVESDVFFKVWKSRDQIRIDETHSIKSYLYTIARNAALDRYRRKQPRNISVEEQLENGYEMESEINVEGEVQKKEVNQVLHEVVAELGEPDNQVFLCKYFMQMRNKEIADKLNLTGKKVENILYRGKKRLRELLEERGVNTYEQI